MLTRFVARALASSFIRHATVLASGTLAANLITLAMLPVFARMFPPEQFGLQSLMLMGSMVLGTLASGYYDWAIPTPKTKRDAQGLATIALTLSLGWMMAGLLLAFLFGPALLRTLDVPQLGAWMFAVPPLAFANGCFNTGNYWLLRSGRLGLQTNIRFAQPISTAAATLGLGMLNVPDALIIGYIIGMLAAGTWSLLVAVRAGLRLSLSRTRDYYLALAHKFREFPLFGSIPSTMMILAGQIPLLVITRAYALDVTGHYAVVRNILYGGTVMIAGACGQVLLKHMAEYKNNGDAIWPHYIRILGLLALAGFALGAGIYITAPLLFGLYLGEGWSDSATIARLIAPVMPFWLMGMALACAPMALRKLKPIAGWQVCYGLAASCLFLLKDLPFEQLVQRVITFEACAYALYVVVSTATVYKHGK